MSESDSLAERFEAHRSHLRAVAYRLLGSFGEAEDAVQEAWLRLGRAGAGSVDNLAGWLTTVVARVSLDMLRSRKSRREEPWEARVPEAIASGSGIDPERETLLADAVGPALLLILETLTPGERLAYVLHDMFDVSFEEIAVIVGRSPVAARQLASRARRRVRTATPEGGADLVRQREMVAAFLAASREGDFEALLKLLDPEVVLRADRAAVHAGAFEEIRGAEAVAAAFRGRAPFAEPALVGGAPGAVRDLDARPRIEFSFTIARGKIVEIRQIIVSDPLEAAPAEHATPAAPRRTEEPRMGILTEDMKRVVAEQRLSFVATVCPDGTPNLSPKGTTAVWDDDHLVFADIRSPGTVANLRRNPALEINVVDQLSRRGYRFKGTAEVLTSGPVFEQILAARRERGAASPLRTVVLMRVERALPVTSPAYDLGVSEDELRASWRRYWETLWSRDEAATPTGE